MCKAALERFSTGLAAELYADDIAVNALSPTKVVPTPGTLFHHLTSEDDPNNEPPSVMAEAALRLCSGEPKDADRPDRLLPGAAGRAGPAVNHEPGPGRLPPAHGRVRGRGDHAGPAGRAGRPGKPGRGVHHRPQRDLGRRRSGRDLGVRVIVGEEIRTPDGDIIGLFLTERVPYVLPVAEVVARIRSQGGLVYAPHPFDEGRSSLGRVLPGLCAAGAVDIVEVFNAKIETRGPNERAAALATAYALPGGAGLDAHDPAGIGAAYLEMPDFDGPASFLAALADARITGEYRPHAPRYPRRPALQSTPTGRSGWPAVPGGRRRRRGTARWPWPA